MGLSPRLVESRLDEHSSVCKVIITHPYIQSPTYVSPPSLHPSLPSTSLNVSSSGHTDTAEVYCLPRCTGGRRVVPTLPNPLRSSLPCHPTPSRSLTSLLPHSSRPRPSGHTPRPTECEWEGQDASLSERGKRSGRGYDYRRPTHSREESTQTSLLAVYGGTSASVSRGRPKLELD